MNKSDLIESIANSTSLTKVESARALEAVIESITDTLKRGGDVRLTGFGTFTSARTKAREGRNPRNGAKIKIPASTQPKFRAGKALKSALN